MNQPFSLDGCTKCYSLQNLNVAGNKIHTLDVIPVSCLPNFENLNLQGNQVTTVVDYRLKVFESFGKMSLVPKKAFWQSRKSESEICCACQPYTVRNQIDGEKTCKICNYQTHREREMKKHIAVSN